MMDNKNIFGVSEVNEYIKMMLNSDYVLSNIWIRGEISNFKKQYSTGHLYFSLKDRDSIIKAVMFSGNTRNLKFTPCDGDKVIIHGRISEYTPRGEYQIYSDEIQPDGIGALSLEYERLRARLASEGLFDEEHKKKIPEMPTRVGVITSASGAAIHDILNISGRRSPKTEIVIFPALVQGENAAKSLSSGIIYFNERSPVDVIIIGRGGGSLEDLWAFNDEELARQIYASNIPIVSAVGHETDFTICDFVADLRAPTPSGAAEMVFPDNREYSMRISYLKDILSTRIIKKANASGRCLSAVSEKIRLNSPERRLNEKMMLVSSLSDSIDSSVRLKLLNADGRIKLICTRLSSSNPLAILSRGYSMIEKNNGEIAGSAGELGCGDRVQIIFSDGKAKATIDQVEIKEKING